MSQVENSSSTRIIPEGQIKEDVPNTLPADEYNLPKIVSVIVKRLSLEIRIPQEDDPVVDCPRNILVKDNLLTLVIDSLRVSHQIHRIGSLVNYDIGYYYYIFCKKLWFLILI